jgi:hypothetical protein
MEDALSFNTLADPSLGAVPLSTPLLLLRNNETTRRWWHDAESWLRARERVGSYSLRRGTVCKACTGPLYWFDEHGFGNYWRAELTAARTAYVCCAFDDHHSNRTDGCTVTRTADGAITRTCSGGAADFAWDGGSGGALRCDEAGNGHLDESDGCAKLPRHGASAHATAACASPGRSYGYDVAWEPGRNPSAVGPSVSVIGGGDSAGELLEAARGRCRGVAVSRTVAAFHAAKSKHTAANAREPLPGEAFELHPRFLR